MAKVDEILAKSQPQVSLLKHTYDCVNQLRSVLQWKDALIHSIAYKHGFSKELLVRKLFLTVVFHDLGKATLCFQQKIRGIIPSVPESHALASVPFLFDAVKKEPIYSLDEFHFYPEVLAVASHHTRLHKALFVGYKNASVTYVGNAFFEAFYSFINDAAHSLPIPDWQPLYFHESLTQQNIPYHLFYDNVLRGYLEYERNRAETEKFRDLFLLFKSVLHYSDWLASGHWEEYQYGHQLNRELITGKMSAHTPAFKKWASFQTKAAGIRGNILVQIPTGQGKTEASVLWAVNGPPNQKILFLMPTMVTTDKMWRRIKNFFGGQKVVGLSHGTAQYVLKTEETEIEPDDFRLQVLYNRCFFKPVTVATIDQLIYSFFNWGHWVLTGAASFNASIVIDEIHVYDAYTFGIILQVLECLKAYPTRLAIMSASLPNLLKEELEKVIQGYTLITDKQFDTQQRHLIEVHDIPIESCISEILTNYKEGLKVLVVCNTILKAREIFDLLKQEIAIERRMLYHSQFILKDKKKKEACLESVKDISGGFVAVCTQIVEVSLDIDFDTLYTENAPIDAIIQRLGRVNRRGKIAARLPGKEFARVVITHASEKSVQKVYKKAEKVLIRTYQRLAEEANRLNGNLQEKHLKAIVDEIYTRENMDKAYFQEMEEAKALIKDLWSKLLRGIFTLSGDEKTLNKLSSRTTEYITVEAVLVRHNQELNFEDLLARHQYDTVREYILKIPYYLTRKKDYLVRKLSDSDIFLMDLAYNEDEGLSLRPDDQNMM